MESLLVIKAKTAWQAAAAKAERVLTEIKADLKADHVKSGNAVVTQVPCGNDGKGELPWVGKSDHEKRHEAEFCRRILEISKRPEDYLLQEYDDGLFVDMGAAMQSAGAVLEWDKELKNLRVMYVPKRMKEQEFWRRYFISVKFIKQEILDNEQDIVTDGPILRYQRSSQDSSIVEAESQQKDPVEEEACKKAFSVVAIPPSMVVRRLASAIRVGRSIKSMKDLANLNQRYVDKDGISHSGDWSGLVTGLSVMRKLSHKEKRSKSLNSGSEGYHALLWSLFEADIQFEEKRKFSGTPPLSRSKIPLDVHGAPPDSFVARLAEIMAGIKSEQKMAEFWLEAIKELRRRWAEGRPISRVLVDSNPDLQYCLLHQQLQLINCCMARRKRRAATLASLNSLQATHGNDSQSLVHSPVASEVSSLYAEGGVLPSRLFAKQKNGQLALRVGVDHPASDLRMLETGEPIYSPMTQEGHVLTEDLLRETEELILRTGSVGAGCSQLLSDMQAFKAANPGCILEDFVRWYSPLDWREDPLLVNVDSSVPKGGKPVLRGNLSARMQCKGNLWQELWTSARPVPAVQQAPLFDEELAGESTLDALENLAPSDIFEQLFIAALSAGFAIAECSPAVKQDPLAKCFKECSDYVIATCGRGMSSAKLEHLCEVYEVMESTVHIPLEEILDLQSSNAASKTSFRSPQSPDMGVKKSEPDYTADMDRTRNQILAAEPQIAKGDNIFSRMLVAKTSFFERKNLKSCLVSEGKKFTVNEGEWTMV